VNSVLTLSRLLLDSALTLFGTAAVFCSTQGRLLCSWRACGFCMKRGRTCTSWIRNDLFISGVDAAAVTVPKTATGAAVMSLNVLKRPFRHVLFPSFLYSHLSKTWTLEELISYWYTTDWNKTIKIDSAGSVHYLSMHRRVCQMELVQKGVSKGVHKRVCQMELVQNSRTLMAFRSVPSVSRCPPLFSGCWMLCHFCIHVAFDISTKNISF